MVKIARRPLEALRPRSDAAQRRRRLQRTDDTRDWGTVMHGDDRGSVSLELVVLGPGLLLFIVAVIFGGRVAVAGQAVDQAAGEAARTASIARTQTVAGSSAEAAARATLAQQGLQCQTVSVAVDTSGFSRPVGTPATVTATVACIVDLADLAIPGLPGTRTVRASASSPIDTYRQRAAS